MKSLDSVNTKDKEKSDFSCLSLHNGDSADSEQNKQHCDRDNHKRFNASADT
jgi:hypothetical protein